MSQIAGSFQWMKSINRSLILNMIRVNGPISRAEIAKRTKLTPPTVTNLVSELITANIVKESKIGVSKGGRKPILLTIEAKNAYVIGLDVGGHRLRAAITDLNAEIEEMVIVELPSEFTGDGLISFLVKTVEELILTSQLDRKKIIGIGVGMHGIVDREKGVAVFAPNFNLKEVRIKDSLEEKLSIPTIVENDARALALGESWFGNGKNIEHVICINVGVGIGAGIIVNNKLFHGEHHIAGEIGHTIIDINGKKCTCGSYGCLQTLAGGNAIRERIQDELSKGRDSILKETLKGDYSNVSGEMVHEAALRGDPLAIEVLADVGRYLGIGITNLINVMNPNRIIIGGGVSKADAFIMDPLKEVVRKRALTLQARNTEICTSILGEHGTMIGASTLILQNLFDPDHNKN
jgi:glucokinase-like ROK family protein